MDERLRKSSAHLTHDPTANVSDMSQSVKQCPYCAEQIAEQAIKCKHCGSMLDGSAAVFDYPPTLLTIPIVVSAVWNVITGATFALLGFSFLPCVGLIVAVPYLLLAYFEIETFRRGPMTAPRELYDRCGWLGVCQIILGLTNVIPIVCGILLLVYRDRLLQYQPADVPPVNSPR